MKIISLLKKTIPFLIVLLLFSCKPREELVYYQNIDEINTPKDNSISYEVKIQPDDLLMIIVSAEDPEIAIPFNLSSITIANTTSVESSSIGRQIMQSYLVDKNGDIEFPIVGKLRIGGLTRTQVLELLKEKIGVYIKNPIINIRITNFKVALQGEVTASEGGKVTKVRSGYQGALNPMSEIKWDINLSANEKKTINYTYEVWLQVY